MIQLLNSRCFYWLFYHPREFPLFRKALRYSAYTCIYRLVTSLWSLGSLIQFPQQKYRKSKKINPIVFARHIDPKPLYNRQSSFQCVCPLPMIYFKPEVMQLEPRLQEQSPGAFGACDGSISIKRNRRSIVYAAPRMQSIFSTWSWKMIPL